MEYDGRAFVSEVYTEDKAENHQKPIENRKKKRTEGQIVRDRSRSKTKVDLPKLHKKTVAFGKTVNYSQTAEAKSQKQPRDVNLIMTTKGELDQVKSSVEKQTSELNEVKATLKETSEQMKRINDMMNKLVLERMIQRKPREEMESGKENVPVLRTPVEAAKDMPRILSFLAEKSKKHPSLCADLRQLALKYGDDNVAILQKRIQKVRPSTEPRAHNQTNQRRVSSSPLHSPNGGHFRTTTRTMTVQSVTVQEPPPPPQSEFFSLGEKEHLRKNGILGPKCQRRNYRRASPTRCRHEPHRYDRGFEHPATDFQTDPPEYFDETENAYRVEEVISEEEEEECNCEETEYRRCRYP